VIEAAQDLIERLAQSLGRSVALDDGEFRLLVYSTHFEDADPARLNSLIGRRVNEEQLAYLTGLGVRSWHNLQRVPPSPALGIERGRICVPLRTRFELLGFMWIIEGKPVSSEEEALIEDVAKKLEDILGRKSDSVLEDDSERQSLTLALLSEDSESRNAAADDLSDLGLFRSSKFYVSIVISVPDTNALEQGGGLPQALMHRALSYATRARMRDTYSFAASVPESLLIMGFRNSPTVEDLEAACRAVILEIRRFDAEIADAVRVGIGAAVQALDEASVSYEQALVAIKIGTRQATQVTFWAEHPIEAGLATLLVSEFDGRMLPPVVQALSEQPTEMLRVLEAFLDNAGNVITVAEKLGIHRTTVYYRLNRFSEVTGFDLDDGRVRLLLHLWLKVQNGGRFS
jgi:hypothetical protein